MYIESKASGLTGPARIGRVSFSKTMKRVYYKDQVFQRVMGYKYNHRNVETRENFWISGPKKRGGDRLYGEPVAVEIDEDVRVEYWTTIRNEPHRAHEFDASR
jgi:hypothetical protein